MSRAERVAKSLRDGNDAALVWPEGYNALADLVEAGREVADNVDPDLAAVWDSKLTALAKALGVEGE